MRRTLLLLALATLGVMALGATASAQPYDDGYAEYVIDADTVEVWAGDGWYPAQILQVSGNSYLVHYLNSTSEYDEWVDASQVRAIDEPDYVYTVDQPLVQYYWGTTWYDARVVEVRGGRYRIFWNGRYSWVPRAQLYYSGRPYRPVYRGRHYRARSFARSARWGNPRAGRHAAPARRGGAHAAPARRGGSHAAPARRGGSAAPAHRSGGSRGGYQGNHGRRGGSATPAPGGNNQRRGGSASTPQRRRGSESGSARGSRGGSRGGSAAPRGTHGGGRRGR